MATQTATTTPTTNTDLGFSFTAVEQVSKPLLKQEVGQVYFFKILGVIHEMTKEKGARKNPDGSAQKPMEICNVFNYADKTQYQLIVNSVLGNTLRETYPNNSYIGQTFRVSQTAIKTGRGGNKYAAYDIVKGDIKGVETPDAVFPPKEVAAPADAQEHADAQAKVLADSDKIEKQVAQAAAPKIEEKAPAKVAPVVAASAGKSPAQAARK